MKKEDFIRELDRELEGIGIKLNQEQEEQLYMYMNLLIEWNKKINLTAITEPKDIILKHFVDSLTIKKHIKNNTKLIDIGTGAGFPGIPIKIENKTLDITLLDSLNKRIKFLDEVIKETKLSNIKTIHGRIEEIAQNEEYREKFDVVTSRAVANLNVLVEYMLPFVKIGGICICMKGAEIQEEIKNSKNAIEILGGQIEEIKSFELSEERIKRNIVIIRKNKNTPNIYPRKPGTPSKSPLK